MNKKSVCMNLGQIECPLEVGLANDLSSTLEEDAISISWYEAEPNNWILSILTKEDQQSLLREKILTFFREKKLPPPQLTETILSDKDWVAAVYRDLPSLTIGRFYIYGSHIQDSPPAHLVPLHIE